MHFTVIVPVHGDLRQLERCLSALDCRPPGGEVIVVGDGAPRHAAGVAERHAARFVGHPVAQGPAFARNRGAALAQGEILVFVDSDVVVAPPAIGMLLDLFAADRGLGAAFGAYDEAPDHQSFISQYRNLAHSYVHQQASPDAQTFWAGLGAVRADAFRAVGGFDERFAMPSVEDIDLGYRLRAAGHRIRLQHQIRGCHLKRWTLWSSIRIDIWCRGVPWTQLLLRSSRLDNDLNLRAEYRVSVVCAYLLVLGALASAFWPPALLLVGLMVVALAALNWRYYRYFARQRGLGFALRVFPLHVLHHLCNGISFVWGTAAYLLRRWDLRLPGALPIGTWNRQRSVAGQPSS